MNSEKEFKDNLKDKLNSKEFAFDEANWQQARQLIDASRKENKRAILPFILLGLLFIGSGISGFYLLNNGEAATQKGLAVNSVNAVASEVKERSVVASTEYVGSASTINDKGIKNPGTNAETKHSTTKAVTQKITNSNKNVKAKNSNDTNEIKTSNKQNARQNNTNIAALTVTRKTKKQKGLTSPEGDNNTISASVAEITKPDNKKEEPVNTAATTPLVNNTEPVKEKDEQTVATTNTITPLAETKPGLTAAIDSATKTLAIETVTRTPMHFISLEAGTNYLFGWKNPGKKDANGFNPVIGLNYSNVIAKQATLSFGIQYTMVRNLSYSNHLVTTTRYKFGEESDVMVFTPTTMHYLVAPIRLSYAIDTKNTFGVGCNIGYLFNINSNVELYSQNAGQKGKSTVLKTSGYMQGFKTFDTQLTLFYRRSLTKDLYLHAGFMYGLTDIKDNTFFNSNVKEKNIGLKMTLIYNLFKK